MGDPAMARRVLIVDDAALVRLFYRQALERDGFVVSEALNGVEGLELVLSGPFDLIIVDVNMPQMDGLTFVRSLRDGPSASAATPVMVTSTESKQGDIDAARAAGANLYLTKPVGQDLLAEWAGLLSGAGA